MASVGTHIKRLSAARHMTQEDLAERLFVTRQAVSAWETGKALPDVEMLERIAAALDADVTEVIYGTPQSPDLRRVKRRWALIGSSFAIIISVLFFILLKNGTYGTYRHGLAFQFHDSNYGISYQDIPGSWSVELDLADLESNVGKVLYEKAAAASLSRKSILTAKHARTVTGSGSAPTVSMTAPADSWYPAASPFLWRKPHIHCPPPPP